MKSKSKTILVILLIICLVALFVSIGLLIKNGILFNKKSDTAPDKSNTIPDNMTEGVYRLGQEALSVAEDYRKGNVSDNTALRKLNTISNELEGLYMGSQYEWAKNSIKYQVSKCKMAIASRQIKEVDSVISDLKSLLSTGAYKRY